MKSTAAVYPPVRVESGLCKAVGQAGGVLLTKTITAAGLDTALGEALAPWHTPLATHSPHKIVLDLAVMLALGGDCLADIALLRSEPGVYGLVASDPTVSRMITRLAADPDVLTAIHRARASARAKVWARARADAPNHEISTKQPLIIDVDATLVTAHSEKEQAAATYKRGYGFHPLCAFVDHGTAGTGEPVALLLRAGNAGSNTAADHLTVLRQALAQLPGHRPGVRPGPQDSDPRRCRWLHPPGRGMAHPPAAVLLPRFHPAVQYRRAAGEDPRAGMGAGPRRRRRGP